MTSALPATAKDIRSIVTSLVDSELGTYTRPDGTTTKALYVVGRYQVPANWRVTGVECSIQEAPLLRSQPSVGTIRMTRTWVLTFVNYSHDSTLYSIQEKFERTFPTWVQATYLPPTDESYEQLTLRISDPVFMANLN